MKRGTKVTVVGIILALTVVLVGGMAVFSEPGGTDDPVVTKSYIVDKVIPEIKAYIDERFGIAASEGVVTARTDSYTVVNVSKGETVICEAGTELILRMGTGTIIATQKGGLADTTAGYDLANGTNMPSNHQLIVPVADGRGFKAETDVIVMIKGGYTIK
ncbi:MAG: hypothetical protein IJD36_01745 [Clostridia bacterium]|nr:hypothetical protein [Clostridia bacterium]